MSDHSVEEHQGNTGIRRSRLSRSHTPLKKIHGVAIDSMPRPQTSRDSSHSDMERLSVVQRGGGSDEEPKGDVEDVGNIYDMY